MRYYDIQVGGASSFGSGWASHPGGGNVADPGAQEVLLNLEVFRAGDDPNYSMTTSDNSTIEIKGVSWDQIKHSNQLVGKVCTVFGGMKPGLPLATVQSAHAGKLFTGLILKAWGNWVGTEMSIQLQLGAVNQNAASGESADTTSPGQPAPTGNTGNSAAGQSLSMQKANSFRVNRSGFRSLDRMPLARGRLGVSVTPHDDGGSVGGGGDGGGDLSGFPSSSTIGGIVNSFIGGGFPGLSSPLNLIHNMMEKMPLASAISQTLSTAFPGMGTNINISSLLKLNYQDAGAYQNMAQYATYIMKLSRSIMSGNYFGVHMASHNGVNYVSDLTVPGAPVVLTAFDFIGQPTWIDLVTVEIKVVMRADIKPFDTVTIPAGTLVNVTGEAILAFQSQQRTNVTLEAMSFNVVSIRHIGDFRNPDGNYWCTIIQAIINPNESTFPNIVTSALGTSSSGTSSAAPSASSSIVVFGSMFKRSPRRY
jgi:hypothetical protein